jgi:hypothetical protein
LCEVRSRQKLEPVVTESRAGAGRTAVSHTEKATVFTV